MQIFLKHKKLTKLFLSLIEVFNTSLNIYKKKKNNTLHKKKRAQNIDVNRL